MKSKRWMLFIFFIFVLHQAASGNMPNRERDALRQLFDATNGPQWTTKTNWSKLPGTDEPLDGVDRDSTVRGIRLPNNKLRGSLPDAMKYLVNLEILDLSSNALDGKIPWWLRKLKKLKVLNLSNNNFSEEIPQWIGELENLEILNLEDNNLTGNIPEGLGKLEKLRVLNLGSNHLLGEIPPPLKKLPTLKNNNCNLNWNGLFTNDPALKKFLNEKQMGGNWQETQTIPPNDVEIIKYTEDTIGIGWTPIPLQKIKYEYKIYLAERDSAFIPISTGIRKSPMKHEIRLAHLKKNTQYRLKITTLTDYHPQNPKNRIESLDSTIIDFTTERIKITGTVTDKNEKAVSGVKIYIDKTGRTVETDSNGTFKLFVFPDWTGIIYPLMDGYLFTPSQFAFNSMHESVEHVNFLRECNTIISGRILYKGPKAIKNIPGCLVEFFGKNGEYSNATTDKKGRYEKQVPFKWSGKVLPRKEGYLFKERYYKDEIMSSQFNQDFEAFFPKIFGRVVTGILNKGVRGMNIDFSDIETETQAILETNTETDSEGYFKKDVPVDWKGLITPKHNRFRYNILPQDRLIRSSTENNINVLFKAYRFYKFYAYIGHNITNSAKDYYISSKENSLRSADCEIGLNFFSKKKDNPYFSLFFDYHFNYHPKNNKHSSYNIDFRSAYFFGGGMEADFFSKSHNYALGLRYGLGYVMYNIYFSDEIVPLEEFAHRFELYLLFNLTDKWFIKVPLSVYDTKDLNFYIISLGMGLRF